MESLLSHSTDRWPPLEPAPVLAVSAGPANQRHRVVTCSSRDEQFVAMLRAFRPTGGIARRSEVEARLAAASHGGRRQLATWLRDAVVFAFEWDMQSWIPCFQLQLPTLGPRAQAMQVVRELRPVFDGWELAVWFSQQNELLDWRMPIELLFDDVAAVHRAARFDRYVAAG
jgi:hypothetical protein